MSTKAQMLVDQATRERDFPAPVPKLNKEEELKGAMSRRQSDDEVIVLLKEIRDKDNQGSKTRSVIQVCIAVILCVIAVASILVGVSGDKRELEVKVNTVTQRNSELWQLIEAQKMRIDQMDKDNAVRDALNEKNAAKRR